MARGSAVLSWDEEVAMVTRDIMTRTVYRRQVCRKLHNS